MRDSIGTRGRGKAGYAAVVLLLGLLAPGVGPARAAASPPPVLAQFDAHVERVREAFDVPGVAVAIIRDGEVVLQRGYGIRDLETEAPVDEHTLFAIASNT
ncbi:MAG: serine hydrolase domain-containing protein, partial [Lysobacter spongiicola]|nr:serine hydrolase domain-containing protein [Lysobacter spongiicola]